MNFLKITSRDIKKILKNRFIGISVVAIIITPLFYSLFYLSSFWDPYGNLQNMPVAVVNLDKGTINDSKSVNYGGDLVNELKKNKDVGWQFVSQNDADNGLTGNKYYGEVVIPADFSEKALSAKDGVPEKPNIVFKDNPKKNYIATKIYSSVKTNLDDKITKTLVNEYTKVTFDSLYNVKDGMNQAEDGSSQLTNGILSVKDGSNQLKDGLANANNGSNQLKTGLASAKDGSSQLKDGLQQLDNKIPELRNGVLSLFNGSNQLKDGLANAKDGSNQIKNGLADAGYASNQLRDGLKALNEQAPQLKQGTASLADGSDRLLNGVKQTASGVDQINAGVNLGANGKPSLVSALKSLNDNVGGLGAVVAGLNNAVNVDLPNQPSLSSSIKSLNDETNQLNKAFADYNISKSDADMQKIMKIMATVQHETENLNESVNEGTANQPSLNNVVGSLNSAVNNGTSTSTALTQAVGSIYSSVSDPNNGLAPLINKLDLAVNGKNDQDQYSLKFGMQQLDNGANDLKNKTTQLPTAVSQLYTGASILSDGTNKLYNGAINLNNGTNQLYSGALNLSSGLNTLNSSTSPLADGTNQLYNGANSLSNGAAKLYNGAVNLSDGTSKLYDGANGLQDGTDKLYDGSKELSDKLSSGAEDLNNNLKNSSTTMGNFVSQPINVKTEHLFADETYGVALAPYFIPISIWVGAILMFFVVSDEVDEDIKAKAKSIVMGKYLVYIGIGALQAICVSTAVLFIGIRPSNLFVFYLFNIFISFVFISIIQCLIFLLKDVGRLLGIILLVLQLASSAGTFPIELSPKFYRVISPFMPFTYVVSGLREVINGINYSVLGKDIAFLVFVFIIFFTLSLTFRGRVIKFHEIIEEKKNESVA